MNYLKLVLFAMILASVMTIPLQGQVGQTNGVIDFEGLNDQEEIFEQFWDLDCGVRFYFDNPNSGNYPRVAQVGPPRTAFFGPLGQTSNCVSNAGGLNHDMPATGENVGCFFLTDDTQVGLSTGPLIVEYASSTTQASGNLLDIDGMEEWTISAFNNTQLVATVVLNTSIAAPTGNGIATPWQFNTTTAFNIIEFAYTGQIGTAVGLAFDNFFACGLLEDEGCCPDLDNLVENGQFDDGNSGFTSDYQFDGSAPSAGSLWPGEYAILDDQSAPFICEEWEVCPSNGNVMAINGATVQNGRKLVWEQTISGLNEDEVYQFCAQFRNLPQCCFDVQPEIDIIFSYNGVNINTQPSVFGEVINTDPDDPCDWELIERRFRAQNSDPLTIQIWLDEFVFGDGNDLLIDNISLANLPETDDALTVFGYAPNQHPNGNPDHYMFDVTALEPIPEGCSCSWEICELDPDAMCIPGTTVSNDPQWWSLPNYCDEFNFAGYNGTNVLNFSPPNNPPPGIFDRNRTYKIRKGVWCECSSWTDSEHIIWFENLRMIVSNGKTGEILYEIPIKDGEEKIQLEMETIQLEQFKVFPNPTSEQVTIYSANSAVEYEILNADGQVVLQGMLDQGNNTVAIKTLPQGLYIVQVKSGSTIFSEKLILTR